MQENKKRKKAVAYYRQSSGGDDVSLSIADQIIQCRNWAEAHGVEILKEFSDFNTPGELYPNTPEARAFCNTDKAWQVWRKSRAFTKDYRRQLGELFTCLRNNSVDYVIVHERTRLYRSPNNSFLDGFITNELAEKGIAIVDVTSGKVDNLDNVIDIAVQKLLATYEMSKIDEKAAQSKRVRAEQKEKGIYYSNAFGVGWVDKKIVFPPDYREALRMVFDGVEKGWSYGKILNTLNTHYFHLRTTRNGKQARCFYETNIYNILKNPVYCGYFLKNGEYTAIANMGCEPILPLHRFLEIRQRVSDRKGKNTKQKLNTSKPTRFLPLSGLLVCGNCGKRLSAAGENGVVYFCKHTSLLKDKQCTQSRIRISTLRKETDQLLTIQALFPLYLYHRNNHPDPGNKLQQAIRELTEEIAVNRKNLAGMIDLHFSGLLDRETFKWKAADLSGQIRQKENRLLELRSRAEDAAENHFAQHRKELEKIGYTGSLLTPERYFLLARAAIREIAVFAEQVRITLFDGNVFFLPRITGKYRSKRLPPGQVQIVQEQTDYKVTVFFYDTGEVCRKMKEKILLDTPCYRIILRNGTPGSGIKKIKTDEISEKHKKII